ncbi:MAG: RNA polymerase sigma factor RpoS [Pseudomonadota bacterium]
MTDTELSAEQPDVSQDDKPEVRRTAREEGPDVDATAMYLREIGFAALLTPDEEIELGRRVQQGDAQARKRMIESNLRLVVKIARRYLNRGLPLLDLIEEGNLGLMHAIEKFDPELGYRLSTYATWWIRQNIERALMSQTRTIRLPVHVVKELNVYLRAARELAQKLDHEPKAEDVAELIDKPIDEVRRLMGLNERTESLDALAGFGDRSPLEYLPDSNAHDPADLVSTDDLASKLEYLLEDLSEQQQAIIVRRFGLRGYDNATLEQVGAEVGLTRERVRQMQLEALRRLRRGLELNGLSEDECLGGD